MPETIQTIIQKSFNTQSNAIAEDEAKTILKACGIPVVAEARALTPEAAARAAVETGFPVVLKAVGSKILHKTEAGLVRVGLNSEAEVTAAAKQMRAAAGDQILIMSNGGFENIHQRLIDKLKEIYT